jgi:hypothetical protein
VAWGTSSQSISNRFSVNAPVRMLTPVRLPPGWARLATRPNPTGSPTSLKTVGIVEVAFLAASAGGAPPPVTITLTLRLTKSAASAGNRS